MKKVQLIVLLLSILIPAMSFAQHRESKKAKIARLERENAALAAQNNVYQSELEKARHLSDSIANVNSTNAARLAVAVEQIKGYSDVHGKQDDYTVCKWVISSADFSEDTILKAVEADVHLIDGKQFSIMLLNAGIGNLEKAVL